MGALNNDSIISFSQFQVVEGNGDSGINKKTKNKKTKTNREVKPKLVDPIRDESDLEKVDDYLQREFDMAVSQFQTNTAIRNKLLYRLGTKTGFRVSDLVTMTWGLFYDKNGEFRVDTPLIREQKTGKLRKLRLVKSIRSTVEEYVEIAKPDISKRDDYVFWSRTKLYEIYKIGSDWNKIIDDVTINVTTSEEEYKESKHRGLNAIDLKNKTDYLDKMRIPYAIRRFHLTDAGVRKLVKKIAKECSLKGNFASRSLRKTYAYRMYSLAIQRGMTSLEAAGKVQVNLNHENIKTTLVYLGIVEAEDTEFVEAAMDW